MPLVVVDVGVCVDMVLVVLMLLYVTFEDNEAEGDKVAQLVLQSFEEGFRLLEGRAALDAEGGAGIREYKLDVHTSPP